MRLISKWLFRIRATLFPGHLEEAMKEEMAFHMEMEAKKLMAKGMDPKRAFRKARRDFGEPEYHKEKSRESWGIGMIQNFRTDARHTIRALRRVAASELSLDAPIDRGDRDSASFGERFAGAEASDIEEDVEAVARRDFLESMFEAYLTERERKILYLYYGLDDGEERTLEEIGSLLGVTRERIRQIRNRAFEKLRESPHGESLSGFWMAN